MKNMVTEALKEEMRRRGLVQQELADAIGLSRTMVGNICCGMSPIRADTAVKLEGLGIRTAVEWLTMQAAVDVARIKKERADAQ